MHLGLLLEVFHYHALQALQVLMECWAGRVGVGAEWGRAGNAHTHTPRVCSSKVSAIVLYSCLLCDLLACNPANQGSQGNISGTAWIADGSGEKTTISSVAPLVLISAPHSLVYSLTETLDQKAGLPLAFSFSWSNGKGGNNSVAMTVSAVSQIALADSTFSIPSDYNLVTKG